MSINVRALLLDDNNCASNVTDLCLPTFSTEGLNYNVTIVATPTYSIKNTDDFILATGGGTFTLPTATGTGKQYNIKNISAGEAIVASNSASQYIDGQVSQTLGVYDSMAVIDADANSWYII